MDAITQQVLTTSGFYVDAQEYQPAHVFINGKYIAMMNIREPNNRFHGVAYYGYDNDEMDAFEYSGGIYRQKGGAREAFDRMIQLSYGAESDEGYAEICKLLDMDEFVRYMAAICYTNSGDWLLNGNNVKGYRSWEDGKFHFVFFDQDLTWERTNNVEVIEGIMKNEVLVLYNNLKYNHKFRQQFVAAYCILHGSIYTPEGCQHVADSICDLVADALSFDNRYTESTYSILQQTMWGKRYREARIKSLMNAYALSDSINVYIGTNCAFARIQVNGMDVPFSKFSGVLFGAVSVTTNSAEGYHFVGWRDQYGRWLSCEMDYRITQDGTYTAVYEKADEVVSPICINEISAANDIYVNDYGKRADWIELFNRGQEPVDVAQWFISDDEKDATKYQIGASDQANTIIQPNGHLVIWCDGKSSESQLHLPFKLKNESSILILQSPDGEWKDSVRYDTHSSKETVGRFPDGGRNLWTFYHPTIGTHNMATTYDSAINIDTNAIRPQTKPDEIESISYYTISGIRTFKPQRGMYIKEVLYKNGQKRQSQVVILSKTE